MKFHYRLCLILSCILLSIFAYAIPPSDSVKARNYLTLLNQVAHHDPDSAFELGRKAKLIADYNLQNPLSRKERSVFLNIKGNALFNLACIDHMQGEYARAEEQYLQAIKVQKENGDQRELGKSYNYLSRIYEGRGEREEFFIFMKKALKIHQRIQDTTGVATDQIGIADYYFREGKTDSCLIRYEQAIQNLRLIHRPEKLAFGLYQYATILKRLNQKEKAIDLYYEALTLQESIGHTQGMAQSYLDLGLLFADQGDFDNSLSYFERAKDLGVQIKSKPLESKALNGMGKVYALQQKHGESLKYYEQVLQICEDMGEGPAILAICLNNIATQYKHLNRRKEAITALEKAVEIGEGHSLPDMLSGEMINLAALYYEDQHQDFAKKYAQRAFELAKKARIPEAIAKSAGLLADIYEAMDQPRKALSFFKIAASINDSIEDAENTSLLLEKEAQHQVIQKDYELQLSNNQLKLLGEQKKLERRTWMALVSGLLLLIVCGTLAVAYRNQKRKATEQQIHAELLSRIQEIEFLRDQVNTQLVESTSLKHEELSQYLDIDLSRREIEVLQELCKGKSNQQISEALFISVNTVRSHLLSIYHKLDVKNRTQAVKKAVNLKLTD